MATVVGVITDVSDQAGPGTAYQILWEAITAANAVGDAKTLPAWTDRSVQIVGTFDSATIVLQGSNDGATWATLTDPQGNVISATSTKLEQIEECTRYIRPSASGGGGSQDIDVYVFATGYRVR